MGASGGGGAPANGKLRMNTHGGSAEAGRLG